MSILDAAIEAGRAVAESRMTSRATVRRRTGASTQDEETGLTAPVWEAVYTDLPCRIAGSSGGSSPSRTTNVAGGVQVQTATRTVHLPWDTILRDGDMIEVTVGEVAGTVWQVVEADAADQQTARRVPVIATERPGEWEES